MGRMTWRPCGLESAGLSDPTPLDLLRATHVPETAPRPRRLISVAPHAVLSVAEKACPEFSKETPGSEGEVATPLPAPGARRPRTMDTPPPGRPRRSGS